MTRCHILVIAVVLNFVTGCLAGGGCPAGYSPLIDMCYRISTGLDLRTVNGAEKVCNSHGGTLAVIPNASVQNFIVQLAKKYGASEYWVGLQCKRGNLKTCSWDDGSSVTYNNFHAGYPMANGNCVHVDLKLLANGRWFTSPCALQKKYVCQITLPVTNAPTNAPTTTILPSTTTVRLTTEVPTTTVLLTTTTTVTTEVPTTTVLPTTISTTTTTTEAPSTTVQPTTFNTTPTTTTDAPTTTVLPTTTIAATTEAPTTTVAATTVNTTPAPTTTNAPTTTLISTTLVPATAKSGGSCYSCDAPIASNTVGTTNAQVGETTFTCYTGSDGCPRLNVTCTGYDYALLSDGGYFFPPPRPNQGNLVTAEISMSCAKDGWTPDAAFPGIDPSVFYCDVGRWSPSSAQRTQSNCASPSVPSTQAPTEAPTTTGVESTRVPATTDVPTTTVVTTTAVPSTTEEHTTTTTELPSTSTTTTTVTTAGTPPFSQNSTMVPSSGGCNSGILKAPMNIATPNYPYNYPPNIKCYYQLQAKQFDQRLTIVFNTVDVESTDPIYVYDGPSEKYPLLGQFHSKISAPQVFNSSSYQMLVTFSSDDDGQNQGFKAKFTQLLV